MTAMMRPKSSHMTRDEFVLWDAPAAWRWQLIDGEPIEMAPASQTHGLIQAELIRLIGNALVASGSPCRVVDAPGVVPRIRADANFRVPDIAVTCVPDTAGSFIDDPIALVEILSPSNESLTRANVWAYTTIPSVQEVLLVRSSRTEAELLRRGPDGSWPADPVVLRGDAALALESIGFVTPLAALYRTTGLTA